MPLRRLCLRHRLLATWLVALALAMRLVVPSGYMLDVAGGTLTIALCPGYASHAAAMPGMAHHPDQPGGHGKAELPCPFAGLAAPALAAAEPLALAAAFAFIPLAVFRIPPGSALPGTPAHLRPPLRGPPAA